MKKYKDAVKPKRETIGYSKLLNVLQKSLPANQGKENSRRQTQMSLPYVNFKCKQQLIVGGDYANIKQFPHSTFLAINCVEATGPKSEYRCGASILNQDILLTAAHCLAKCSLSSKLVARVGHENFKKGFASTVHSFIVHKDYERVELTCDIAVVKLKTRLKLSRRVGRVAMMKNPPYYEPAKTSGWGVLDDENKQFDDEIKFLKLLVWKDEDCKKYLTDQPNGTICATSLDRNNEYPSRGDSGNALVVREYIQIGLLSYRQNISNMMFAVFSDVGYYYDWIVTNTKLLYCRN